MVPPDRLTALFAEYHGPLVRFLTRRLGDRDAAEEIAQETFMRALKQETITSERSWLFAVASNLVRDEGRRTQRQQRRLELLREREQADAVVDPEPTSMERDAERELARRALEALGERDRDVLLMREEGLDYEEIARARPVARLGGHDAVARAAATDGRVRVAPAGAGRAAGMMHTQRQQTRGAR